MEKEVESIAKKGQLVLLGLVLKDLGDTSELILPCLVTKEHEPDENGIRPYDFVIPLRGNRGCEFVSRIDQQNRYLHRMILDNHKMPDYFISYIKNNYAYWCLELNINKEDLFYNDDNDIKRYLFTV